MQGYNSSAEFKQIAFTCSPFQHPNTIKHHHPSPRSILGGGGKWERNKTKRTERNNMAIDFGFYIFFRRGYIHVLFTSKMIKGY